MNWSWEDGEHVLMIENNSSKRHFLVDKNSNWEEVADNHKQCKLKEAHYFLPTGIGKIPKFWQG